MGVPLAKHGDNAIVANAFGGIFRSAGYFRSGPTPTWDRNVGCDNGGVVIADAQRDVVDYLMNPSTHGGSAVERIDTHSAIVFLAGSRALKLKRAVRFDYLDFSTEPLRRAACEAEFRINRRAAPSVYVGVVALTRETDGSLALNGRGVPEDWLVDMVRFDQDALFDRLASRNALDPALMRPLATSIARFHEQADRRADHGGRAGMQWVVDGNATGFIEQGAGVFDRALCDELTGEATAEIARLANLLDERRREGFVRQCHGDLHLRNIVLLDGQPTLFDAVEFNDHIACIDVLYDVAFLVMDLWRRRLVSHANVVFSGYLADTGDFAGLPLFPLFLSCRAAVRAKTSATAARVQPDASKARELQDLAREYLVMARHFLSPVPARLLAVGGFSGSGKSTLARAVAPTIGRVPGAVVIRSDEIRKELCGVPPLQRLGPEGYTAEVTERVYRTVEDRAEEVLRAGHSAIADAVFARPSDRLAIEKVADATHVPFLGFWLEATPEILMRRADTRGPDASDAGAAVVRHQLTQDQGPVSWHRLDAGTTPESVAEQALAAASKASP
jgi:aminoglycoside phosphotransferase family enzyme/predicted kinase